MKLFEAQGKVQKDRTIMRETDERMAKYSRRGVIVNVLAYLLCLSTGYMSVMAPNVAVALTVGLILFALLRGYFLVRFDTLYASGPCRWRNRFFVVTLLGAAWWSVILVSFTLVLGIVAETPILWFYTVIFFASTVQVTAPYKRFSQVYLSITLLPPVIAGAYVGGFEGYMYSLMMLVFVIMMFHQVEVLCSTYWQRLEANYALTQKARALEVEKRDSDASVDLSSQFLINLGHEFRTSLNDILGGLSLLTDSKLESHQQELLKLAQTAGERQLDLVNNIVDFSRISNRKLVLDHSVFNLRSQIEAWLSDMSVDAHQQGVELDYRIAAGFPLRARGDAGRMGQIVKNMLGNAIQFSEQGMVFADIDFKKDSDKGGLLEINLVDRHSSAQAVPNGSDETEDDVTTRATGLWLTICKGLAECMGGSIEIETVPGRETQYQLWLPLKVAGQQASSLNAHPKLRGKRVLMVDFGLELAPQHFREMEDWGLDLIRGGSIDDTQETLERLAAKGDRPDLILINLAKDCDTCLDFSRSLLDHELFRDIPQLLLLSHNHLNHPQLQQLIDGNSHIVHHYRPFIRQSMHDLITHAVLGKPMLKGGSDSEGIGVCDQQREVLLVDDHRVNQMVAEGMLKKLGYSVRIAGNGMEALCEVKKGGVDLILMDCQMPEMDGFEATRQLRQLEQEAGEDEHIPVIAMTAHTNDGDQSLCFASGMDDYLAKPVRYEVLETLLLRWLGGAEEDGAEPVVINNKISTAEGPV